MSQVKPALMLKLGHQKSKLNKKAFQFNCIPSKIVRNWDRSLRHKFSMADGRKMMHVDPVDRFCADAFVNTSVCDTLCLESET